MEDVQNSLRSPGTLTDMACPRCGSDCSCACSGDPLPAHDWRRQISLQVRAHKARKRRRLDPDAPLLDFQQEEVSDEPQLPPVKQRKSWWDDAADPSTQNSPLPTNYPSSEVASEDAATDPESKPIYAAPNLEEAIEPLTTPERPPLPAFPRINGPAPKVIEFPRTRQYELAEPIADQLRIFEALEELPPLPPSHLAEIEIAPEAPAYFGADELEVPIQAAPVGQRIYATAVDAALMLAAILLFGAAAQFVASAIPITKPLLVSAAICIVLLLGVYYVLSLSLSRSTPGMLASGLYVLTFKGEPPTCWRLRWRALATVLSFAALGMGFVWALIDEDRLCWHDRITHTYLTPR
ncbi:MAG TPA: RDD family protein [Terriglobales bacterium]|nr:RDD family protein [Terriglobales bacterium]